MYKNGTLIMDDSEEFFYHTSKSRFSTSVRIDCELAAFAQDFSIFYKTRTEGRYYSKGGRYMIYYVDEIRDNRGNLCKTPARVGLSTGKIELNKSILDNPDFDDNFVFYMILWCYVEGQLQNTEESDKFMLDFYLKTTRSRSRLYKGLNAMFRDSESLQNMRRNEVAFDLLLPSDAFDEWADFEFKKRLLIC